MTIESSSAPKTVLLTGATGFVGRQIMAALCERGHKVRAIVRGAPPPLADTSISTPDLFSADEAFWAEALEGVDAVIHAAWYAEPGKYLTSPHNLSCLQGTLRLGTAVRAAGIDTFVGVGTCFEYDVQAGIMDTRTPLRPTSPYAAAKASAFMMLEQLFAPSCTGENRTRFAWCRLFYLHGEGEDPRRLVPYLHAQLSAGKETELTSGRQIRDFMDVARAGADIARVALQDTITGPVNICSGHPITVRQLAEQCADVYGRRDLLRFGARPDNIVDPPCVVGLPTPLLP